MQISLRPYQQEAVNAVYKYIQEHDDNPCVVLPTATGKSIVIAKIASDAVKLWNGRVLVLAHVKELLEQNADKIRKLCPDIEVGIYSAGLKSRDTENQIIVAGIQSVYNKAEVLGKFDLVIVDEAHLIPTSGEGEYRTFLAAAKELNPLVRVIGFTATPYRLTGGTICKPENILNAICYEAGIKEMIVNGYISPIIPKGGNAEANLDDLHIRNGEFVAEEVDSAMNDSKLVMLACKEIVDLTKDRKAVIIFGCNVSHCKKIKQAIEELSGEECAIVTGDTNAVERATIVDRIRGIQKPIDLFGTLSKPLKYLVNCAVLTTGFDAPNIDCVAIMRPTASPGLLVQVIGRGFRLSPETGKKNCLVLDYGQNIMRHGPIDAIKVREGGFSKKDGMAPVKKCPKCSSLVETARRICPDCGYEFPQREASHDYIASQQGLLTGQVVITEYDVVGTTYRLWHKKNDDAAPPTVCVEYMTSLNSYQREWICPEHTGYARRKFETWWNEHCVSLEDELPATAEECLSFANNGFLKPVCKIKVRRVGGEKFDRIVEYEYAEVIPQEQMPKDNYYLDPEYIEEPIENDVPF